MPKTSRKMTLTKRINADNSISFICRGRVIERFKGSSAFHDAAIFERAFIGDGSRFRLGRVQIRQSKEG